MDFNKLNPLEWGKSLFKELESIRYCYFLAFIATYSTLFFLPTSIITKLELFKYIGILSLLAIFSTVILLARITNFISLKFENYFKEKEILKYLKTLEPDEINALSLGVICNQQTFYMDAQGGAATSLLQKNLIIKCEGTQQNNHPWPFIIPHFVWKHIIKDSIFKEKTKEEILSAHIK